MRVLRIYHAGRDPAHRLRDRALVARGVEVVLVVPHTWPDSGAERRLSNEPFRIIELEVNRAGDVNRHRYTNERVLRDVIAETRPDVLDIHEEPFCRATQQWMRAAPRQLPIVLYTAQNIDKRYPPPFAQYERAALRRASALYPCSRQAASVARGKGFGGLVEVLPLGYDSDAYIGGRQSLSDRVVTLGLVGRLVPEKGVLDAVHVLAAIRRLRPARLVLNGSGPEAHPAMALADDLGVRDDVQLRPWTGTANLAQLYAEMHVLLVPSRATRTWVEQFGRVIVEAQASGAVVAGYRSGAIPEVAGQAAVLVPERDIQRLTAGVVDLLTDSTDFERRRARGLASAADRTWTNIARRQIKLYEAAVLGTAGSWPTGRSAAHNSFGPPAEMAGGGRPFALPVLRNDNNATRLLGKALDVFGGSGIRSDR
jgi:glycosyltransferase involved in cell wall biosynthesis